MKNQEQKEYEAPQTTCLEVELEQGFMKASVFENGTENAEGVAIEKHGFANPGTAENPNPWEGNYTNDGWD